MEDQVEENLMNISTYNKEQENKSPFLKQDDLFEFDKNSMMD